LIQPGSLGHLERNLDHPPHGTETKADILSKGPPVSSKKIHTPEKFPELATRPFFESKSAASTTSLTQTSVIVAWHWRLKLSKGHRYIADETDQRRSATMSILNPFLITDRKIREGQNREHTTDQFPPS